MNQPRAENLLNKDNNNNYFLRPHSKSDDVSFSHSLLHDKDDFTCGGKAFSTALMLLAFKDRFPNTFPKSLNHHKFHTRVFRLYLQGCEFSTGTEMFHRAYTP